MAGGRYVCGVVWSRDPEPCQEDPSVSRTVVPCVPERVIEDPKDPWEVRSKTVLFYSPLGEGRNSFSGLRCDAPVKS